MDGVAVETVTQEEQGKELLTAQEDSAVGSDAANAPIERVILECTE
jgi:hypothetical protein